MALQKNYIRINNRNEALPKYLKAQLDLIGGFIIILTGGVKHKMGVGKSWTAARIGELVDEDFSVDKMCGKHSEFLLGLEKIENSGKPYQVIVMDEAAVEVSNKKWQSDTNQLIGIAMDTLRNLKCIAIFITPQFFAIDKTLRTLPAYWGYTIKARNKHGHPMVLLYFRELNTDQMTGKTYYSNLRFHNNITGRVEIAKAFVVKRIDNELAKKYEEKSKIYKSKTRRVGYEAMLIEEESQSSRGRNINLPRIAQEVYENPEIMKVLNKKGRINESAIQLIQPTISSQRAKSISKLVNLLHERKTNG